MIKDILIRIAKSLMVFLFNRIYNYVDENKDGVISLDELKDLKNRLRRLTE